MNYLNSFKKNQPYQTNQNSFDSDKKTANRVDSYD